MPYILISCQVRIASGPTTVGDAHSDPNLMQYLKAKPSQAIGNNFSEYISELPPRTVLDMLEAIGWKVVSMTGVGQTCIWTLCSADDMPYIVVTVQIRLHIGPCTVGDSESDPKLMEYLEAKPVQQPGYNFIQYITQLGPRKILNLLEMKGYKVVNSAGIGQTCAWTLHKNE